MMDFTGSADKILAITSSRINLSQRTLSDIINFFDFLVVGFILGLSSLSKLLFAMAQSIFHV
ncbi:hypothetical protein AMTRI_Chr10g228890 [Amborella trichopoda]